MRSAEVTDYWRKLDAPSDRRKQLRSFTFVGLRGLADGAIAFSSPITALCGLSGAGKSALLRAIWAVLDWSAVKSKIPVCKRLEGAELCSRVVVEGNERVIKLDTRTQDVEGNADDIDVYYIDLSTKGVELQERFCGYDVDNLLDAYSPIELEAQEVNVLSFVCKKDYERVRIYEIDEFGEEAPFIEVQEGDNQYDVRTMSLGEISVIVCFWILRRAKAGTIILFEEPETYIPPVSQGALMDFLAMVSVRQKLSIVFTTHSPQMVSRLSEKQVIFLYRDAAGSHVAPVEQYGRMKVLVGLQAPVDCILVVEDRVAREFVRLSLALLDSTLITRSEILDVGGATNVTAIRKQFPRRAQTVTLIGIYDGDMRGQVREEEGQWPLVFLPGVIGVEKMFRECAAKNSEGLAERLRKSPEEIAVILGSLHGLDDHDWFEELSKRLGIGYEQTLLTLFSVWHSLEPNAGTIREFIRLIHARLT